jgi:hypothetical protein
MDGGGRTRDGGSAGSSIGVVGGQRRPRSTRWRLNRVVDAQTRGVSRCAENASYADGGVVECTGGGDTEAAVAHAEGSGRASHVP